VSGKDLAWLRPIVPARFTGTVRVVRFGKLPLKYQPPDSLTLFAPGAMQGVQFGWEHNHACSLLLILSPPLSDRLGISTSFCGILHQTGWINSPLNVLQLSTVAVRLNALHGIRHCRSERRAVFFRLPPL